MSAISSINSGQGLIQYLQQISSSSPSNPASSAASAEAAPATKGHHHDGGGHGGMQKLQDAVTSALQSAQGGNSSSDPNQVIEDAIAKVLKGVLGSSASGTGPASGANAGSPAATGAESDSAAAPTESTFAQMLSSFGVNAQQFHSDFLAAIKDAQSGQVDPSTAFQSLPPGSLLDEIG